MSALTLSGNGKDRARLPGLPPAQRFAHGTRSRYTSGCRCDDCKRSNVDYYHRRQAAKKAAAPTVTPSGPAGEGVILRAGVRHKVRTCPGAGGAPCVRTPAAWLRGDHDVCGACVERATVWNGNIPVAQVREHLLRLRRAGVGYKSVAAACDVSATILAKVLAGEGTIRAKTAKRVLEVDVGARSDGAIAPKASAARMLRVLARLVGVGFRKGELAWLLGSHTRALQLGKTGAALVSSVGAVDRLWRKWERGEVRPRPAFIPAGPTYAKLRELVEEYMLDQRWLSERLGFTVNLARQPAKMRPESAAAVDELLMEILRRRREGEPLEDGWQQQAPEWRGEGWGLDRPISTAAKRRERAELKRLAQAPRLRRSA
jgi:hypothetical protein